MGTCLWQDSPCSKKRFCPQTPNRLWVMVLFASIMLWLPHRRLHEVHAAASPPIKNAPQGAFLFGIRKANFRCRRIGTDIKETDSMLDCQGTSCLPGFFCHTPGKTNINTMPANAITGNMAVEVFVKIVRLGIGTVHRREGFDHLQKPGAQRRSGDDRIKIVMVFCPLCFFFVPLQKCLPTAGGSCRMKHHQVVTHRFLSFLAVCNAFCNRYTNFHISASRWRSQNTSLCPEARCHFSSWRRAGAMPCAAARCHHCSASIRLSSTPRPSR